MSTPPPAPPGPLPQRGLRIAALALQAAAAAPLLLLGVAAAPTPLRDQLQSLLYPWSWTHVGAQGWMLPIGLGLGLVALALAVFLASWRLQARSGWRIALGYVALGAVLAYLARDDSAIRRPAKMEDLSPAFPGAQASFEVLMRYGRAHPLGKNFKAPAFKDPYPLFDPDKPGPWHATITGRRAELEAHWAELAPERAWIAELNGFERIGDLTPVRMDAEVMGFQSIRSLSHHAIAIASLQALDGHGDEAIDTLLPVLQVARKLQAYSRTLVRTMISITIERLGLQTAAFILDNSAVSPAARARLAAALRGGEPEAGARRLIAIEYAFQMGALGGKRVGDILAQSGSHGGQPWLRAALNGASPFLYNPRATFNLDGNLYADLEDLAGRRQTAQMGPRIAEFIERAARPSFKNLFGKMLARIALPAYVKVTENYWRVQDLRAALIARTAKG